MKKTTAIYKRRDGRYEVGYRKGLSADGHVVYGSIYGKTEAEIYERLTELGISENREQKEVCELNLLILGAGTHGNDVRKVDEAHHIFIKIRFLDDKVENELVIGKRKKLI